MSYCSDAEFRAAMARWCTGVSVVTVREDDHCHGMTVSAVSSVSLHPPMILVCLDTNSRTAKIVTRREMFAVNILSAGQSHISDRFAGRKGAEDRFAGIPWREGDTGLPLIENALVNLECEVAKSLVIGDHIVFVAGVCSVQTGAEVDPLLYFRGGYSEIVYGRRKRPR